MSVQEMRAISFSLDLMILNCAINKEQGWTLYLCVAYEAYPSSWECCLHWAWLFLESLLIFSLPLGSFSYSGIFATVALPVRNLAFFCSISLCFQGEFCGNLVKFCQFRKMTLFCLLFLSKL